MKFLLGTVLLIPILGVIVLFSLPLPQFEIEAARPNFWSYPSLSEAKYKTEIMEDGKVLIEIQHPVLKGVTPEMLSWWYRNLSTGKATMEGKEYDYYHLFHLTEHGQTSVVVPATDGSKGMGIGAVMYRQERFGPYLSKGKGRVESFDVNGYVVIPVMGPLEFGRIEHKFLAQDGGTIYTVKSILGSDAPVIGPLLSYYIRTKQFPPEVVHEWIRHQVEEVGSLVHFLPKLYQEKK